MDFEGHKFPSSTAQSSSTGASHANTCSAAINFFSLPSKIRKDVYQKVLIVAHPILLFQEPGSRVETFAPDKPSQWLALLYTNRQMHNEASAVLYRMNSFTLVDTTRQQVDLLQSFLHCLGTVNADFLSHLNINFPVTERVEGQPGKVKLRADSLQSLKLLQENCTNLTTLEAHIHHQNSVGLTQTDHDSSQFIREALSEIDAQLNAIPSLNKVIVRVYDRNVIPQAMDSMRGLGWIVLSGNSGHG